MDEYNVSCFFSSLDTVHCTGMFLNLIKIRTSKKRNLLRQKKFLFLFGPVCVEHKSRSSSPLGWASHCLYYTAFVHSRYFRQDANRKLLLNHQFYRSYLPTSVVDPNTLNLDPDPGFWLNLDPDPGL